MRFRVTSVAGSEEGARLNEITVRMEEELNAELGVQEFGSSIDQFTLVVISVYDEPEENEVWCKAHRKIAMTTNPFTGETVRYLSVAVPLPPKTILASEGISLCEQVTASVQRVLATRPGRLPAGLDFKRLSAAVTSVLIRSAESAV